MPGGVAETVFSVRVVDFAEESVITIELGLKLAVVSVEKPLATNEIVPVKPPCGVAVMLYVVLPPGLTIREPGDMESEKSAAGVVSEILATKTSCPPADDACSGAAIGKLFDDVKPVTYALFALSTVMGFVKVIVAELLSVPLPPK